MIDKYAFECEPSGKAGACLSGHSGSRNKLDSAKWLHFKEHTGVGSVDISKMSRPIFSALLLAVSVLYQHSITI